MPTSDPGGNGTRFGCGALLGVFAGLGIALREMEITTAGIAALCGILALLCGLLARRYGDRFWEQVLRMLPW